jgi:LacI family transcriptional regulator
MKLPGAVTIRDVAARAGVSPATVSRTMNNSLGVDAEKRRAVLAVVRELGFRPNRSARSLKSKRFGAVALIVADIANPFFAEVSKQVGEVCDERDATLVLCDTDHRPERLLRFLDDLRTRGVDGIVVLTGDILSGWNVTSAFSALTESGVPIVFGNDQVPELAVHRVLSDEAQGFSALAQHLVDDKLFPVAYVGNTTTSHFGRARAELLTSSLNAVGRSATDLWFLETPFSYEHGRQAVHRLIQQGRLPRTIVTANAQLALGVLRALGEVDLRVPEDVAVAGIDDIGVAAYANPALTMIHGSHAELGRLAAETIFDLINGVDRPPTQTVSCSLIVRESTTRPTSKGARRRK